MRRWLRVINTTETKVPLRSDVLMKRAGELAFEFAEDGACFILVMGAVIHAGRDVTQRVWLSDAFLYQSVSLLKKL